jgi:hypothetical protein
MNVLQHPDMIASCLHLHLSIKLSIVALGTLVVLGTQLLQTSKHFQRKKKRKQTKHLTMRQGC